MRYILAEMSGYLLIIGLFGLMLYERSVSAHMEKKVTVLKSKHDENIIKLKLLKEIIDRYMYSGQLIKDAAKIDYFPQENSKELNV